MKIGIIDYNNCNLYSIYETIKTIRNNVSIIDSAKDIKNYDRLIIPGVGSANSALKFLKENGFIDEIKEHDRNGKHILGICLGMQLFFSTLHEHGQANGFGFFKSNIVPIKNIYNLTTNIGWRKIINTNSHRNFLKIKENSHFYFCHSYYAEIINEDKEFVLSELKKIPGVPSIINKDNIVGFQFHPEKSQRNGIKLLENYFEKYDG